MTYLSNLEMEEIRERLSHSSSLRTHEIASREQIEGALNRIDILQRSSAFLARNDPVRAWVFTMVLAEMASQDNEHGYPRQICDGEKLKVLVEEVGEVAEAMQDGTRVELIAEYIQVAACAIQQAVMVERED